MEAVKEHQPDLIVTDLFMPKIDGERFIKTVRGDEQYKDIPIIVATTADRKEKIISCFSLGANDFIGKPYFEEEVIARLKKHLKCPWKPPI